MLLFECEVWINGVSSSRLDLVRNTAARLRAGLCCPRPCLRSPASSVAVPIWEIKAEIPGAGRQIEPLNSVNLERWRLRNDGAHNGNEQRPRSCAAWPDGAATSMESRCRVGAGTADADRLFRIAPAGAP